MSLVRVTLRERFWHTYTFGAHKTWGFSSHFLRCPNFSQALKWCCYVFAFMRLTLFGNEKIIQFVYTEAWSSQKLGTLWINLIKTVIMLLAVKTNSCKQLFFVCHTVWLPCLLWPHLVFRSETSPPCRSVPFSLLSCSFSRMPCTRQVRSLGLMNISPLYPTYSSGQSKALGKIWKCLYCLVFIKRCQLELVEKCEEKLSFTV